ncbi:MAG: hypothetical protein DMF94_33115 [Acidobacteria bacterium]|nr:MAG: hypothetical protein DMF96_09775 [Acidobacteriota bacterium]PYR15064.1 MAG: hypothetical protein DMF94_33115 [Acidobacteriota bacterium]
MLREATVADGAVTARNVLWKFSKSVYRLACRSLSSGSRTRTPPLADFHRVSLTSPILPLTRSSLK